MLSVVLVTKMKKAIFITIVALALTATPVFAVSDHANEHALDNANRQEHERQVFPTPLPVSIIPTVTPIVSPTAAPEHDEDNDKDKNDQQDAGEVLGLQSENSSSSSKDTKCDPNTDYKNHGAYVSCVAHEHQGGEEVAEAAHTDIGKDNEHGTVTPTPSVPVSAPVGSVANSIHIFNPIETLGNMWDRFFGFFKHLI